MNPPSQKQGRAPNLMAISEQRLSHTHTHTHPPQDENASRASDRCAQSIGPTSYIVNFTPLPSTELGFFHTIVQTASQHTKRPSKDRKKRRKKKRKKKPESTHPYPHPTSDPSDSFLRRQNAKRSLHSSFQYPPRRVQRRGRRPRLHCLHGDPTRSSGKRGLVYAWARRRSVPTTMSRRGNDADGIAELWV